MMILLATLMVTAMYVVTDIQKLMITFSFQLLAVLSLVVLGIVYNALLLTAFHAKQMTTQVLQEIAQNVLEDESCRVLLVAFLAFGQ